MRVKLLYFGFTHELTGMNQEVRELPDGQTLDWLWNECELRFPRLRGVRGSVVVAVNQEIADAAHLLRHGDEVAFLPPVSGGASRDFCRLTRDVISTGDLAEQLKAAEDGAVVAFEGIVRNNLRGRRTRYLEYEAYEAMAVRKMEEIGTEAKERFAIDAIGIIHRLGRLEIGETSVAIIVTAAHRRAAFEAGQYAIDRLKQVVPIWKKEFFEDGAVWAEGESLGRWIVEPTEP